MVLSFLVLMPICFIKAPFVRYNAMKPKDAIKILINSPIYFKLDLRARMKLIREFCKLHEADTL